MFGLIEEYYNEDGSLHHTFSVCPQEYSFSRKEDLRKHIIQLEQKTLYGYAWNKIYSLSYLRKIGLQYENVTLIEDIVFNIKFCENIDSMNILAFTPYHYGKRLDTSLTSKFVPDYFRLHRQRVKMLYEQFTRWNVCTKDTKGKLGAIYVRYIFSAIQRNCDKRSKYSMGMRIRWCRQLFQDELFQGLIPYAAADSLVLKCLIVALRLKSSLMCIGLGRFIYIVKEKTPLIFAKVKQKR